MFEDFFSLILNSSRRFILSPASRGSQATTNDLLYAGQIEHAAHTPQK